ncbi:protein translocase subunit secG [Hasllibacter halocynthiae]|uniref:Protein-export membrane protein SecG n=1 Tax=Hasllibacter halocynthiae TaxID=595589 RepID=A0A2T0X6W3_9RHOB|nr:preprotein translocase subunit SecG [Hasllibacter halocynthiae]PRY94692.1 protein translocase subunit secG [Hasllibacter halocynthiae]
MQTVVLTVHLLLALALIAVVLLQRSEGGGLGMGGGGGGAMSGRGSTSALGKATWALGIAFVATSLSLTILAAQQAEGVSVLDRLGVGESGPSGEDLIAPLSEDAPLPPVVVEETPAAPAAPAAPVGEVVPVPPPAD